MRARYVIPAFAAVAALLLTGCVDNSTPSTGSTDSGSSVTKDDAAAALLPDAVASSGKLIVGTDAAYPPNEFKDAEGKPIGWGIEIASAIAAKLGLEPDYQISKFDNIIPSIMGGKVDIGESSFTDTIEREKQVDFVSYYTAGILWASAAGTTVDPNDACGLTVAVQATTYQDTDEVPAKSEACVAAGKPPINKVPYDTQDFVAQAVILGSADAMSADSPVTLYAIAQSDGKMQSAGEAFEVAPYGIAVAKDGGMGEAVQFALQSMIDDGSYQEILDKWGVADGGIDTVTINAAANG
ncbi:ABC transporter substrate-binding protein [Cryobacterium roopkundense]|uniref:ABC transporter substrate-binding protein n=1 Tax=Cryobacterium roopkundense TaxID=1001240 RepID=A0A099JPU2_9MICO|nr:ABC transporter substrate-binding protein [Cryobacterium roopkundense]KGJ79617.1 ABC transporter substrate-binding protein [Cryobacterium roopkundense]MBB5639807.1 polar amino acid transport system substrate-binding protein [Cryobacterium roopkundense]